MNTHKLPRFVPALLPALALIIGPAPAQVAPAAANATPATAEARAGDSAENPILLSPFTVTTEKDKGYKAANATSGTRLNTAIKDAPLPIEVITNDFMRDIGAKDLRQALQYSAGILLSSQNDAFNDPQGGQDREPGSAGANDPGGVSNRNTNTGFKLRGYVNDQVLRDGFRRQFSTDWINIDRVEVVRGPEALLYGVGSFGGVVNYLPKRPQQKEQYYTGLTIGTEGFVRAEFDATGAMGNGDRKWSPAYRVTGAVQRNEDYTDYYENRQIFVSPVFTFRPFQNTEVLFDNEIGIQKQEGIGFQTIRLASPGSGAQQRGATFWPDTHVADQRTFRWSGPDTYLDTQYSNHVIDITQKVTDDLFLKAGVTYNKVKRSSRNIQNTAFANDLNYFQDAPARQAANYGFVPAVVLNDVFNMQNNPTFTVPPPRDSTLRYTWEDRTQEEERLQYRVEGTYNLEFFGKHTLLAGVQSQYRKESLDTLGYARTYTNYNPSLQIQYSFRNPNDFTPFRFGTQGDGTKDPAMVPLTYREQQNWDLGYYAAYQGRFFKERLTIIGGYRWDRNDARGYAYERDSRNTTLTDRSSFVPDAPTRWSPQIGASFAVTNNLSVFGLYSTGLLPNYDQQDGNGTLSPTTAKNIEYGIKFDLLDGRVSGTVSAYKIDRKNTPRNIWWAPAPYKASSDPIDPTKPRAALWAYMGPENLWYAVKFTPNGLAVAKEIFPVGWHAVLDRMAATPGGGVTNGTANPKAPDTNSAAWGAWGDPTAPANQWNFDAGSPMGASNNNTWNPDTPATTYFPLVNLDKPAHEAFVIAALESMGTITPGAQFGWSGNFYTERNGQRLRFGDGTIGVRNIPHYNSAAVPMDDRSEGVDAQIILTPTDNWQIMLNYAHTKRQITTETYHYVKTDYYLPIAMYYYPVFGWGTLDARPAAQAYADTHDTSTFQVPIPEYGQSLDDTPEHQASIWTHYRFDEGSLKGLGLGLGARYEGKRQYYSGFAVDGTANAVTIDGQRVYVQFYTPDRYTVDLMFDYNTRWKDKYNVRYALNVSNLLDDQGRYGFVFAPGMSARFTTSISF